jgi:hypothetical protein
MVKINHKHTNHNGKVGEAKLITSNCIKQKSIITPLEAIIQSLRSALFFGENKKCKAIIQGKIQLACVVSKAQQNHAN